MIKNPYLIIFFIFIGFELTAGAKYKPKVCSPHNIESCPSTSVCQQLDNNTWECSCREEYELNPAAENDNDYCIHIPVVQPTTAAGSTSGGGGGAGGSSGGLPTNSDKTASAISQNEPPSSHHIISGILIPIFIVLVVIGVAYGVKRLNIVRRFRDIMVARRNRPFYEDVMMSNDNDDPPLI